MLVVISESYVFVCYVLNDYQHYKYSVILTHITMITMCGPRVYLQLIMLLECLINYFCYETVVSFAAYFNNKYKDSLQKIFQK